jgi:coenzyme F420-reducing hydrogenase beta subunit
MNTPWEYFEVFDRVFCRDYKVFLGDIRKSYLAYASDESVRERAASGGVISALLIHLLKRKLIDGALICRSKIENGEIGYEILIAKNRSEILSCATSKYFDIPMLEGVEKIKKFKGRVAVVGLPCQIRTITKLMEHDPVLRRKIVLKVGLFCGHVSEKELMERVLRREGIALREVKELHFRLGHWRGETQVLLKNGRWRVFPFNHFGLYQNLFFFSNEKCFHCYDHTSELADISCGDAWLWYLKKRKVKYSVVCCRNEKAEEIMNTMIKDGIAHAEEIPDRTVFESQRRSCIFQKSINARTEVGKLFRMKIGNHPDAPAPRPHDYLANLIALVNHKLTTSDLGKDFVFTMPREVWYPYLLFFKLLTNF